MFEYYIVHPLSQCTILYTCSKTVYNKACRGMFDLFVEASALSLFNSVILLCKSTQATEAI